MALTKRKVVYILIPLILVACVAVLAALTWHARTRYRVTLTIEDRIPSKAHIADLIFITKSNDLLQESYATVNRDMWDTAEARMEAGNVLYTREIRQIGNTSRLTLEVTSENEAPGTAAIKALSQALIRQYDSLMEASTPVLRVAGEPTISRTHQRLSIIQVIASCSPIG